MFTKKILLSSLISSFILTPALADNKNLDSILVTATRIDNFNKPPASISVITAEEIKLSPSRTIPDLLAEKAGVNVRSTTEHKNSGTIDIRGFGETAGQNTLILLDGRRLNDVDLSNINFAAIPFQNIERIEIIRGSGAVLYGDGATGGVINIITKNPANSETKLILNGKTGSDNYNELNAFGSYSNGLLALNANINTLRSDGYRDHSDFSQNSGQLDFRLPVDSDEFYLQLGGFDNETELPGTRNVNPATAVNELQNDRRGTNTPLDWANERTSYINLGYTAQLTTNDHLILDGGLRDRQQKSQFDYGIFGGAYADTTLQSLSFTPRLIMKRQLAEKNVQWIIGMDWYDHNYDSDRSDFRSNSSTPFRKLDVDQQSLAFYGQGTFELTTNTTMTAGFRTQEVKQKAQDTFDASAPGGAFGSQAESLNEDHRENSFEVGLNHAFTQNLSTFIRAGRSARFATVDELFQLNELFQQEFSVIVPQTALGTEFGLNYDKATWNGQLAIFQQHLDDEIRLNPMTFQNENLDKTKRKGIELSGNYRINSWLGFTGNYTYLSAKFRDGEFEGNTIPLVAEHSYALGLNAKLPSQTVASLRWNHVSSTYFANDLSNEFHRKIPSYQTVDLNLLKAIGKLEVALILNNIFNEKYYTFGVNSPSNSNFNAYPLPERTVYLTASYQFD